MMGFMTELRVAQSDFDRTTTLTPSAGERGSFSVDLDAGWSSLVGVHGGYMCALAVRAAEAVVEDRTVRTLTTSFLRTAAVGPANLSVREVRRGRSMSTVVVDIEQGGRHVLSSRLTALVDRTGVEWSAPEPLDLPPVEQCVPMEVGRVSHFGRVDGLLDPAHLPASRGDRAIVQGYVRPLEGRRVDAAWLAMATDWFPPPAFVRIEPPTGGVSIDLTTHIHQPDLLLGDDDWLRARFEIRTSTSGLAVEHGLITTADGTPVAESFQTRLTAQD
jgi:acyl-CoA thioesterase